MEIAGPIPADWRPRAGIVLWLKPEWPPAQAEGAGLLEHRWGTGNGRGFLSRHSLGVRVAISQGWGVHQILLALTCILIRIESPTWTYHPCLTLARSHEILPQALDSSPEESYSLPRPHPSAWVFPKKSAVVQAMLLCHIQKAHRVLQQRSQHVHRSSTAPPPGSRLWFTTTPESYTQFSQSS